MPTKAPEDADVKHPFDYNVALRRLIYVVAVGCSLILTYGLRYERGSAASFFGVVSVGLMAGGAALLSGGLLGFLFGVPHTREGEAGKMSREARENAREQQANSGTRGASTSYRPNTSLEQISDWLTKMLVGVGLVQIKVIPGKLTGMAAYIARGLGNGEQAEAFALNILVYFSVCGFVFGFLWARLFLVRWFREADEVQVLGEKVSRLEKRQQADARALALINQQINREADDPPATEQEVAEAIKASSVPVKIQIFSQAQKASAIVDAADYDIKVQGAISILKGLIASDTNDLYHRNHSELSYALRRKKPPDLQGAEKEITKAIEIRDTLGKGGWKYYEFHRARCRIEQDPNFKKKTASDPAFTERILSDLRAAYGETDKWNRWYQPDSNVWKWMEINKVDLVALRQS